MTRNLLTPLSPEQELALRRIANGALTVDDKVVQKLLAMALVQRTARGHRLTPLGRLRYDALPKAPLLARQRSLHAVTGYVEGLIEKAQSRRPAAPASKTPDRIDLPVPGPASEAGRDDGETAAARRVVYVFLDSVARARDNTIKTRGLMMAQQQRQIRLYEESLRRIEASQVLLKQSVPVRPAWLSALR